MANMEVRRILVDQGSSVDVIFEALLEVLKISRKDLTPYSGRDLSGFNGASNTPLGHLELMVTFGDPDSEEGLFKTVKTTFLVLPCKSQYQCIIGRPTIGKLEAVTSTLHLKMKFCNLDNKVVTIPGDIGAAQRCYYLNKNHFEGEGVEGGVNMINLHGGYDPDPEEDVQAHVQAKRLKIKKGRKDLREIWAVRQLAENLATTMTLEATASNKRNLINSLRGQESSADRVTRLAWEPIRKRSPPRQTWGYGRRLVTRKNGYPTSRQKVTTIAEEGRLQLTPPES